MGRRMKKNLTETYILLDILLRSIAEYFYEMCHILTSLLIKKYSAILLTKTSNKLFMIQLLFFLLSLSVHFS